MSAPVGGRPAGATEARVLVLGLGGTISMSDRAGGGAQLSLPIDDLLESVPVAVSPLGRKPRRTTTLRVPAKPSFSGSRLPPLRPLRQFATPSPTICGG